MAITGRPKPPLVLTDDERDALLRLTARARVNRSLAFRARLVLACADGAANTAVAQRYRTTNATVGKWRQRFVDQRLDGIYDEPRVGAPRTISDEDVEAVIVRTLETTPPGETHWNASARSSRIERSHVDGLAPSLRVQSVPPRNASRRDGKIDYQVHLIPANGAAPCFCRDGGECPSELRGFDLHAESRKGV